MPQEVCSTRLAHLPNSDREYLGVWEKKKKIFSWIIKKKFRSYNSSCLSSDRFPVAASLESELGDYFCKEGFCWQVHVCWHLEVGGETSLATETLLSKPGSHSGLSPSSAFPSDPQTVHRGNKITVILELPISGGSLISAVTCHFSCKWNKLVWFFFNYEKLLSTINRGHNHSTLLFSMTNLTFLYECEQRL